MADFPPTHPGAVLRADVLEPCGMSPAELAEAIGLPPGQVSEIIAGSRPIAPDAALRLARYFGTSPEFWMGMQATYDLAIESGRRSRPGGGLGRREWVLVHCSPFRRNGHGIL